MDKRNSKERVEAGLKTRREVLALGRTHELKLHVNGALNNGLTKEEIREVFLQVAIYCGVPAAVESFRSAKEVFKERGV